MVFSFMKPGEGVRTTEYLFSPAARAVLDAGCELWRYYHAQPGANQNVGIPFRQGDAMLKKIVLVLFLFILFVSVYLCFTRNKVQIPQCLAECQFEGPWTNFVQACQADGVVSSSLCEHPKLGLFVMVEKNDGIGCLRRGGAVLRFPNYATLQKAYNFTVKMKIYPPEIGWF